jgi:ADP-heptose:LPS heptosyltransferase
MHKFLIIQTAFIGDVVLATPVIESLAASFPNATIDFMLRKGNENLLESHPKINKCWIWNKKEKNTGHCWLYSLQSERRNMIM